MHDSQSDFCMALLSTNTCTYSLSGTALGILCELALFIAVLQISLPCVKLLYQNSK